MNNNEKAAAKSLKNEGFTVDWYYHGTSSGGYYATHPKLVCMYCINTAFSMALEDLSKQQTTNNEQ